jgi:hypothetical protein
MWNNITAEELGNKVKLADETITACFMAASPNKSMNESMGIKANASANSTQNETEGPKNATMCKAQKAKLKEVHTSIKEELSKFLDEIKEAQDMFSEGSISKNGLKPAQLEPFTDASKLVQAL